MTPEQIAAARTANRPTPPTPIQKLIEAGDEVKFMVYGQSGVGKTRFLGTAIDDPRTAPVVWLDLEGGTRTIKSKCRLLNSVKELGEPVEGKIDVLRIKDWTDIQDAYEFLFDSRYARKRSPYRSVVMDSLTEINYMGVKFCTESAPQINRVSLKAGSNRAIDFLVPSQADYMVASNLMKVLLRGFRDLEGLNVFYSALPQNKADGDGADSSLAYIKPNLVGKLADEAVAIMEYVGYLRSTRTGAREMIFQPEGRIVAKERSEDNKWIKKLVDPTITSFMDELEKNI